MREAEYYKSFEPGVIYHVYNRTNGNELMFRDEENYDFFLKRLKKYIVPFADIYAYCLIPNHFHLLLKIKDGEKLLTNLKVQNSRHAESQVSEIIAEQFKNFLMSYAKSYNKRYDRHGSLFQKSLKRIAIDSDDYFTTMIRYIHFNSVLHGITKRPEQWKHNSFQAYVSNHKSAIVKDVVLEWFGGEEAFLKFHASIQRDEFDQIKKFTFD
jgi:putative transposase